MKARKIKISPVFIFLIILSSFFGYLKCAVFSVIFSLLHEAAHIRCAKNFGYTLGEIKLMPYGAMLSTNETFSRNEGFRIALAGPVFSLIIAISTIGLWWLFPPTYSFTEDIFLINILLCAVNLLPVFPLDGSRILLSLFPGHRTVKFLRVSGIAFSIAFLFIFMMSAFCVELKINYSYAVMSLLLLSAVILEPKKLTLGRITDRLFLEKKLSNGVKCEKVLLSDEANLYKVLRLLGSANMVELTVINSQNEQIGTYSEDEINNWLTEFPLTEKIKNILKLIGTK